MDAINLRRYEHLSPFEIKDELIRLARAGDQRSAHTLLNAGRGNPNWVATRARAAFFLLGQFALSESARVMADTAGLGGMPLAAGIADRLEAWLEERAADAAIDTVRHVVRYAIERFGFDRNAFVHELVDAIVGDNYPVPERMLVHAEQVVHAYLLDTMCGATRPTGRFDLFATEGGTAAICYVFRSLKANRLLVPGDRIALGTPIFTPYLEIPELEDYGLEPVYIEAPEANGFQFTDTELAKLHDPKVKAFFLVNPGNPTSIAISPDVRGKIASLVRTRRPDLMLLTDDVYATFVDDFRSLMADLPHNTIGVYSYSKYFGCTGWRLGVIAIHQDNLFDRKIAALPRPESQALGRRYGSITPDPGKMRFIDRLVADSRDVALNHTAGLSTPQQAMMMLFSLVELSDQEQAYRHACVGILRRRVAALCDGLGLPVQPGPLFDGYYGLIDLEFWLRRFLGDEVARFIRRNVHPLDIVFRLAHDYGIVVLNGGGFHAPDWSVRVSFANLDDDVYDDIGRAIRAIAGQYEQAFRSLQRSAAAKVMPTEEGPAMTDDQEILAAVRSALHSESRVRVTDEPLRLAYANGELTIDGEVDHIAGKKLALEAAARIPGVRFIVDRLRVRSATPMGDDEIRDKVRDALLEEITLASCTIRAWDKGRLEMVREPADSTGTIDVRVEDGVVTLDGDVTGAGQKRLAGVLAWWVPGSRDVVNGIGVTPPEPDSEAAVTDAVLQVLERDPFIDSESIRVRTRRSIVTLDGTVPREAELKLAEDDAWFVFGVDKVINRLSVRT